MLLLTISVIFIAALLYVLSDELEHRLCKHDHFYENRACDVICGKCGKNFGFIAQWKRDNPDKKVVYNK